MVEQSPALEVTVQQTAEGAGSPRRWGLPVGMTRWLVRMASILAFLLVWWFLTEYKIASFAKLPGPIATFLGIFSYRQVFEDAWISTVRVFVGFAVAAAIGTPLGLAIGWKRTVEDMALPLVELFRPIPPISWIPLAILLLPTTESSVVFITFIAAFFPIVLNARLGVTNVERIYVDVARVQGADEARIFRDIILPAAMPSVFTGMAIGMGIAWVCVVAAEMIAGDKGIGYRVWESYYLIKYVQTILGMVLIGVLGFISSAAITRLGARLMKWRVDIREN